MREIDGGGHHPHIGHKTRVSPLLIQTGLAVSRSLKLEVDTPTNNGHLKLERRVAVLWRRQEEDFVPRVPGWSEAGKWAALEAARSSTGGSGWAPSGPASPPGRAEPARAARRGLLRRRSHPRALPGGHFDHARVRRRVGSPLGSARSTAALGRQRPPG